MTRIIKLHSSLTNYHFSFLGDADPESNDVKYPVLLMESVHKISQDLPSVLNDKDRKKIAKNGKNKYLKFFNSRKVAKFILNKTYQINDNEKFLWY